MSLSQARLIAIEWKKLRRVGRDPAEERGATKSEIEATKQAERGMPTVSDAIQLFFSHYHVGEDSISGKCFKIHRDLRGEVSF